MDTISKGHLPSNVVLFLYVVCDVELMVMVILPMAIVIVIAQK